MSAPKVRIKRWHVDLVVSVLLVAGFLVFGSVGQAAVSLAAYWAVNGLYAIAGRRKQYIGKETP